MKGGDLLADIRDKLDPNKNGVNNALDPAKNGLKEKFENAFDPNKNGLANAVKGAVEALKNVDWKDINNKLGDALDPKKNGVDAAFQKFGGDARKAFEDLGQKIRDQAAKDKAALDTAFAPFVNEFSNPNSALSKFVSSAGIPLTADDWKKKFEDPETYFTILSLLVTAAASVVSVGMAGPGAFAATQALIASARVVTKAAMGKPVGPGDIVSVVTACIPGKGAVDPSSWLQVASTVGMTVGTNLIKKAATNVISSNVQDRLAQMGETLATVSYAGEEDEEKEKNKEGEEALRAQENIGKEDDTPAGYQTPEEAAAIEAALKKQDEEVVFTPGQVAQQEQEAAAARRAEIVRMKAAGELPEDFDLEGAGKAKHSFHHIAAFAASRNKRARLHKLDPDYFADAPMSGGGFFSSVLDRNGKVRKTYLPAAAKISRGVAYFQPQLAPAAAAINALNTASQFADVVGYGKPSDSDSDDDTHQMPDGSMMKNSAMYGGGKIPPAIQEIARARAVAQKEREMRKAKP
jgi:hypothetical protein